MAQGDMGGVGYGPAGAHCAIHRDQPATATCARCGSFMCFTCTEGGTQQRCPPCQQRVGAGRSFPLARDTWSFSALWDYCFEIFKRDWVMLAVGVLVFFGISFAVQLVSNVLPALGGMLENQLLSVILTIAGTLVHQTVQGVLTLGLLRMLFDMLQGGKADIGRLFSQFHKAGTYLVTVLLVVLMVGLPAGALVGVGAYVVAEGNTDSQTLILLVAVGGGLLLPLLYFLLPLYLIQAEIAYNDEGASPVRMIRNCFEYARGERLSLLGVVLVGALVVIAGLLACCVGALPAMGLSYLLMAGLYLALRNGADVEG